VRFSVLVNDWTPPTSPDHTRHLRLWRRWIACEADRTVIFCGLHLHDGLS